MTSVRPQRPHRPGWRTALRRRAGLLLVAAVLLGMVVVAVAVGWLGWLGSHPWQAWAWIQKRWLASSALAVVVAALGVWVAWATPRRQQHHAEQLAASQHDWQEQQQQERRARERAQAEAEQQAAWAQRCRSLLVCWPLPTIQDANPYEIGVFYSRRAIEGAHPDEHGRPPYVPRPVDSVLAGLLHAQPLVLVKGRSRAGKSRTAFEVAARELAGWRLLVPKDRAALAGLGELDRLPGEGERVLVWLDDLDRYLAAEGAGGLDTSLLARLTGCRPPMKVLATIRLEQYGLLSATPGELGRTTRELLNRFEPGAVTVPVGFDTPDEQSAIAELYPSEPVTGGLAEYLAAAQELVDRLEVGEASMPAGAALVLAAADCRRVGLDRPMSRAELAGLLPLYLGRLRPLVGMQEGEVDRGFGWATEPVGRTAALLVPDPDPLAGTFRVADPVIDFVEQRDGRRLSIPAVWEHLLGLVAVEEAMRMGFAAYSRDEPGPTRAAWQQVIDSGDSNFAPYGALALGMLLEEQEDVAGAIAAYQQAIDSGHPEAAPHAANRLGKILANQGNVAGARAAYQQAIDSGHPAAAAAAAVDLGRLLESEEDVAGAIAAYQQAIDSGHPEVVPWAALFLGLFLDGQGDVAGARAAYQQAVGSGQPDAASMAAHSLENLPATRRGVAGAIATFQRLINSGHPDRAPWAAVALGMLLEAQEDEAGARAAYQQAIDSGHEDAASRARQALRDLG